VSIGLLEDQPTYRVFSDGQSSSSKIFNARVKRALDHSWLSDQGGSTNRISIIANFLGEYLFEACYQGRVTAVELLLQTSLKFGDNREEDAVFFMQIIHSLLLAAVEHGIEDLSRILASMSLSVHESIIAPPTFEQIDSHKLWKRKRFRDDSFGDIYANHLEILAAECGNDNLVRTIYEETQGILAICTGSLQHDDKGDIDKLLTLAKRHRVEEGSDTEG
jgi:hypothetical protein